jgi:phosphoglycerate dehydrogenase-like enzyme
MKLNDITIGVTTVAFSKNDYLLSQLKQVGVKKVKPNPFLRRLTPEELILFLSDCDGAIVGLDQINEKVLRALPKLKFISKYGVGLDNIDQPVCEKLNCSVLHTQGVNKRSVAEMTLGFMLSLQRNLYESSNLLKTGRWEKNGGVQLTGKTVGILGLGNIGKEVIQLLQPFDCKILVNDLIVQKEYCSKNNIYQVTKEEIYKESEIISIHLPLNSETEYLFNQKVFSKMRKGSILINTARGGIVNLKDLKQALLSNTLKSAAIDVYDQEPPPDKELISLPNLINTPHIGGNSREAVIKMGESAIENIKKYMN